MIVLRALVNRMRRGLARWLWHRMLFGERSYGQWRPHTRIAPTTCIDHEDRLALGDHVYNGPYNFIEASAGVTIGEGTQLTHHSSIVTHASHRAQRLLGPRFVDWAQPQPRPGFGSDAIALLCDDLQAWFARHPSDWSTHAALDTLDAYLVAVSKAHERTLEQRVAQRTADLQRFAEVTAHHLQEPARRVASYAGRLRSQLAGRIDDDEVQASLSFISQQAARLQDLLRDVELYLAADQPRAKVESCAAEEILAALLAALAAPITEAAAKITDPCRLR